MTIINDVSLSGDSESDVNSQLIFEELLQNNLVSDIRNLKDTFSGKCYRMLKRRKSYTLPSKEVEFRGMNRCIFIFFP